MFHTWRPLKLFYFIITFNFVWEIIFSLGQRNRFTNQRNRFKKYTQKKKNTNGISTVPFSVYIKNAVIGRGQFILAVLMLSLEQCPPRIQQLSKQFLWSHQGHHLPDDCSHVNSERLLVYLHKISTFFIPHANSSEVKRHWNIVFDMLWEVIKIENVGRW